ncbi:hypothetical protein OsJ_29990 [Oryza sativa Japonica Group]|uniref:Uncharacterized protein n=1 Tax=Oryza sativa subsp. japonica TaxID=39947 RepID=A3C0K6_ORYSJ|nr:hypothetical protein OsJ_29990 [Oryza sativa Japonica Group]
MGLLATCVVLLATVFLEGFRVMLPLRSRDARGRQLALPIKLLYTSTMPVVLHSAAVSSLYTVSQLLHYSRFAGSLLGHLEEDPVTPAIPVPGPAASPTTLRRRRGYPTPPPTPRRSSRPARSSPGLGWRCPGRRLRTSRGSSRVQRLALHGARERDAALRSHLSRYISTAAALGGLCVGALTILADMTGAIGSGTGILLAATVVYNLIDAFQKEE